MRSMNDVSFFNPLRDDFECYMRDMVSAASKSIEMSSDFVTGTDLDDEELNAHFSNTFDFELKLLALGIESRLSDSDDVVPIEKMMGWALTMASRHKGIDMSRVFAIANILLMADGTRACCDQCKYLGVESKSIDAARDEIISELSGLIKSCMPLRHLTLADIDEVKRVLKASLSKISMLSSALDRARVKLPAI